MGIGLASSFPDQLTSSYETKNSSRVSDAAAGCSGWLLAGVHQIGPAMKVGRMRRTYGPQHEHGWHDYQPEQDGPEHALRGPLHTLQPGDPLL
jgi:hypothetical protein